MATTDKYAAHEKEDSSDRSPSLNGGIDLKADPLGVLRTVPDPDEGLSEEERTKLHKKLMWKIDLYLIPW